MRKRRDKMNEDMQDMTLGETKAYLQKMRGKGTPQNK